jgi:hypothetical protein
MSDQLAHRRLRRRAVTIDDPDAAAVIRMIADLHELEWRRASLARDSPEREELDREIERHVHRIVTDIRVPMASE